MTARRRPGPLPGKVKRATLDNAEAIFRSHYPKARIEGHTGNDRQRYYLVRKEYDATMATGEGRSMPQAWRDACERLNLTEIKS